jgi:hypothetical protein
MTDNNSHHNQPNEQRESSRIFKAAAAVPVHRGDYVTGERTADTPPQKPGARSE